MKPYDWEKDPDCSWLRHPAGRHLVQVRENMLPLAWWGFAAAALVLTVLAIVQEFFLPN
jgi:hypothetical protein